MDRVRCDASSSKTDRNFPDAPTRCDAARQNRFANPLNRKSKGGIGRRGGACSKNGQDIIAKQLPDASRKKKKRAFVISSNPSRHSRNLRANLADSQNAISTTGGKKGFRDVPLNWKRNVSHAPEADQRGDLLVVGRVEDHREEPRPYRRPDASGISAFGR